MSERSRAALRSKTLPCDVTSPAAGGVRGVSPRQPEILPASAAEGQPPLRPCAPEKRVLRGQAGT